MFRREGGAEIKIEGIGSFFKGGEKRKLQNTVKIRNFRPAYRGHVSWGKNKSQRWECEWQLSSDSSEEGLRENILPLVALVHVKEEETLQKVGVHDVRNSLQQPLVTRKRSQ